MLTPRRAPPPTPGFDPSGKFDAVIDLDAAVRDPATPANLLTLLLAAHVNWVAVDHWLSDSADEPVALRC